MINEFFYDQAANELFYVTASALTPPAGVFEAYLGLVS